MNYREKVATLSNSSELKFSDDGTTVRLSGVPNSISGKLSYDGKKFILSISEKRIVELGTDLNENSVEIIKKHLSARRAFGD